MLFGRKRYSYFSMVMLYLKLVPWMAATKVIYNLFNAIVPTVSIIVTAMFIDNATAAVMNGGSMSMVIFPLLGIIVIRIFNYYAGILIGLISIKAEGKLKLEVSPIVAERSACVKFKYYENQDSVDTINRVMGSFGQNIQGFFDHFFNVFSLISSIVGFIVILGTKLWWASLVFVATAIPAFIISYQFGKKRYDVDKEMTKIDRRVWYISGILTGRNTVEERYMYGYTPEMDKEYRKNHKKARTARKKVTRSLWVNTKLAGILVFISGAIVVALLVPQVMPSGGGAALSVGMFISLVNALFGLSQQLQETIPDHIYSFRYQFEYLKDLNEFLAFETEDAVSMPASKVFELRTIEFRNVNFRYPGCEVYILKNFCYTLYAGKHYAIVGANGAGKTTVVKLLTGLYDNYEGEILINGNELHTYSPSELKALSSTVYQDFCRYPLDFYHNIAIGNINNMDDQEKVKKAVEVMGLSKVVEHLPNGYETAVTKINENGIDLSGGEWQRVALARLLVSSSPLKILDEPTAALDPISESKLYEQFHEIVSQNNRANSMTLFISHRLGSTKLADEIIVLDGGRVAEAGTFDELISKNGLYAQMFNTQAQWYRDEGDKADGE